MKSRTTERIGANVMGKRMFDQGEVAWPEAAPFHTPVYVLTHEKREPGPQFRIDKVLDGPAATHLRYVRR